MIPVLHLQHFRLHVRGTHVNCWHKYNLPVYSGSTVSVYCCSCDLIFCQKETQAVTVTFDMEAAL